MCPRCRGLMIHEWLNDNLQEGPILEAQRCLMCGHVEDVLMRERQLLRIYEQGLSKP